MPNRNSSSLKSTGSSAVGSFFIACFIIQLALTDILLAVRLPGDLLPHYCSLAVVFSLEGTISGVEWTCFQLFLFSGFIVPLDSYLITVHLIGRWNFKLQLLISVSNKTDAARGCAISVLGGFLCLSGASGFGVPVFLPVSAANFDKARARA